MLAMKNGFRLLSLLMVPFMLFLAGCKHAQSTDTGALQIAGGVEVAAGGEVESSTVALMRPDGAVFCSGVLLDSHHVLTAAHCRKDFTGEQLLVGFGPVTSKVQLADGTMIQATFLAHESFDRAIMFGGLPDRPPNDIAMVTLSKAAPAGHTPATLLTRGESVAVDETVTIAGFGLISSMPSQRTSSGLLRELSTKLVQLSASSHEVLVQGKSGKATCNGDSGGPVYVRRGNGIRLLGVTSRGTAIACESNTIYTDVRFFDEWIAMHRR